MLAERWKRADALFKAALDHEPAERDAFVAQQCRDDRDLHREVASLLAAHERAASFLEVSFLAKLGVASQSGDRAVPSPEATSLPRGAAVGRFLVTGRLGHGGMGVVYAAYDPELNRRVALKLLSRDLFGLNAVNGRARLLREAQALASLSHPNVVAIYDVGTLEDQVFLAMEYVDGNTLRHWLKGKRRSYREVLGLFLQAGSALAAAHAVGLVHRDFKPENVLVGSDGRVRVVDFGLAQAASDELGRTADSTPERQASGEVNSINRSSARSGCFVGTPGYMAPEQLLGHAGDERIDQFSFCVTLHEALCGEHPFGEGYVNRLQIPAGQPKVKETLPPVPRWLRRVLVQGLSIEPEGRYPSMDALLRALDPSRHSVGRRWMTAAVSAALVALCLLGYRQFGERRPPLCSGAEHEIRKIWNPARKRAIEAAFFGTGRPYASVVMKTVAESFDAYTKQWAELYTEACVATKVRGEQSEELLDLRMQCLLQRREEMGALLDLFSRADATTVDAAVQAASAVTPLSACSDLATLKAVVPSPTNGETRDRVKRLRSTIAAVKELADAARLDEALSMIKPAAAEAAVLGYRPIEAEVQLQLGSIHNARGEARPAYDALRAAIIAAEAGRHDEVAAKAWTRSIPLALFLENGEQLFADAREHAFAFLERIGKEDATRADLLTNIGFVFKERGDQEAALQNYQQALAIRQRIFGPRHRNTAASLNNVGSVLLDADQTDESLPYTRQALEIFEQLVGPTHPDLAFPLNNIAVALKQQGHWGEALAAAERALAITEAKLGSRHPSLCITLDIIGDLLMKQGKLEPAMERYQRELEIAELARGPEHPWVAYALTSIGNAQLAMGAASKAVAPLERALAIRQRHSVERALCGDTRFALARALVESGGDRRRARNLALQAREDYQTAHAANRHSLAEVEAWLGRVRWQGERNFGRERKARTP